MSAYYLDTSALVKRYFPEVGTPWVQVLTDLSTGNILLLSEITLAETAAAIAAKQRASTRMTLSERDGILRRFSQHCIDEYILIPVNRIIIDRAVMLTQDHRLRGYDAVQMATALTTNAQYLTAGLPTLTFVTADADLLAAAHGEGMAVENPNTYP